MANFTIEEVYRIFKMKDEKLPYRTWLHKKRKKLKVKSEEKKREKNPKNNGHIDIYA